MPIYLVFFLNMITTEQTKRPNVGVNYARRSVSIIISNYLIESN